MKEATDGRAPWSEDPDWIWNNQTNPGLTKQATLVATVRTRSGDLESALWKFTRTMVTSGEHCWSLGGADIVVDHHGPSEAELHIISGGEDAFESLADAARTVYNLLIEPNPGFRVRWDQLPLESGE